MLYASTSRMLSHSLCSALFFTLALTSLLIQGTTGAVLTARTEGVTCTTIGPLQAPTLPCEGSDAGFAAVAGNESYILGWQLSALFGTHPSRPSLCRNFEHRARTLGRTGLDPEAVKLPFCNRVNCDMVNDGAGIFAGLISHVGGLFESQLTASVVDTEENWLVLCNSVDPVLAGTFFGPGNSVVSSICGSAGVEAAQNPSYGSGRAPETAPAVIHRAATLLLAWQIIALLPRPLSIDYICDDTSLARYNVSTRVAALDLDATLFQNTICQYKNRSLPSVEEIRIRYSQHTAEIFAETLWSLSDSNQFRTFMCQGYTSRGPSKLVSQQYFSEEAEDTFGQRILDHCRDAHVR